MQREKRSSLHSFPLPFHSPTQFLGCRHLLYECTHDFLRLLSSIVSVSAHFSLKRTPQATHPLREIRSIHLARDHEQSISASFYPCPSLNLPLLSLHLSSTCQSSHLYLVWRIAAHTVLCPVSHESCVFVSGVSSPNNPNPTRPHTHTHTQRRPFIRRDAFNHISLGEPTNHIHPSAH